MKESLTYGLPGGLISGLIFFLLRDEDSTVWSFVRQFLVLAGTLGVMFFETKRQNKAYFPFRFAWFSGFNTVFVVATTSALLVVLFAGSEGDLTFADRQVLFLGFLEFMNLLFVGLVLNTVMAGLVRKK